jgi:hypothetical protein
VSDTTTLERARQSLDAHAWEQAYEGFASLDRDLSSEDLERLAEPVVAIYRRFDA